MGGRPVTEVLTALLSAQLVAIIWLARQTARNGERLARLEGRLNGRPPHDR